MSAFDPRFGIWPLTFSRAPAPSAVTVTTAATPMVIPRIVSAARSLFRRTARERDRHRREDAREHALTRSSARRSGPARGAPRREEAEHDADRRARAHRDDDRAAAAAPSPSRARGERADGADARRAMPSDAADAPRAPPPRPGTARRMSPRVGADGHADADLARPLGDAHQHDVHHADAADEQRHGGDRREQHRERVEDLSPASWRISACVRTAKSGSSLGLDVVALAQDLRRSALRRDRRCARSVAEAMQHLHARPAACGMTRARKLPIGMRTRSSWSSPNGDFPFLRRARR